jgi:trigger factor
METGAPVDLKRPETYKFAFRCGIVPPFEYNLEQVYVKDYEVIIDEPTIDKAIHQLQHEHGKFGPADFISSEDIVKGALYDTMHDYSVEENRPENGLAVGETAEETRFYLETYLPMNQVSEAIKQHFLNASVGTIIHFDINELMNDSEKGLTLLTGKTKEEMDKLEGDFAFEVKEILHNSHAELNEELFKKVFPAKEIASTEDFRAAIKEDTAKYYEARNKELKKHQVQKQLIENTQIDLPHDFLKEFFAQRGKNTTEKIEEDYPKIEKSVRWEVISLKMNEKYQFQVSDEEIHNEAVNALMNMYGQYGQSAEIYQYISQMAGDYAKKNFNTLAQSVLTDKILDVVAQDLSSAKQLVSEDEFWEIYRAQN